MSVLSSHARILYMHMLTTLLLHIMHTYFLSCMTLHTSCQRDLETSTHAGLYAVLSIDLVLSSVMDVPNGDVLIYTDIFLHNESSAATSCLHAWASKECPLWISL